MNRIGIDLTLLTPGRVGGVETYVRNLIRCLASLDDEHEYVLFGTQKTLDSVQPNKANFTCDIVVPPDGFRNLSFRLARRVLWDIGNFDLASANVGRQQLAVLHEPLGFVRMVTSTPIVLTVLDIQHEYYPKFFGKQELRQRRYWYPKSLQRAAKVIAISDFTRDTLIERYCIAPEKITTIHLGLDGSFHRVTDHSLLRTVSAKHRLPARFAYYPANSWPHKNHPRLLGALKLLKDRGQLDFKLVLSGVVYPEHQEFFALIDRLKLTDEVIHIGFPPHAELPCIYSLASCLVFPSLFEGFGLPVLEAMGCGCPVVCSDLTSLPELCGDAALLVDPTSEEEIADGLSVIVNDNAVRTGLIRRGLARTQLFSWESMAGQTLQIYAQLVALDS